MTGAAYIREMYDRYGAPGFLAAYNAGPDRLDAYLTDGTPLPDETVNYVASIAPRLGYSVSGPLAVDRDRAYAGGGMIGSNTDAAASAPADKEDLSMRAFPGGGLVTPTAPTGTLTVRSSPVQVAAQPIAVAVQEGDWGIQIGAYSDSAKSSAAIDFARAHAGRLLLVAQPTITPVQAGRVLYRARLSGLSATAASAACAELRSEGLDCIAVPPGS